MDEESFQVCDLGEVSEKEWDSVAEPGFVGNPGGRR